MIYVTTTTAKVAHKSENYRPICGTPGEFHITLAADEMKPCFLCETSTPTPVAETNRVRAGEKVITFIRGSILDPEDTADAELIGIIDANPPKRFGNGYRYTLELTTDQAATLRGAIIALHNLMATKMVRASQTGFGYKGGWLLELADRITTA